MCRWSHRTPPSLCLLACGQVTWRLELTAPGLAQAAALQSLGEPGMPSLGAAKGSGDYGAGVQSVLGGGWQGHY